MNDLITITKSHFGEWAKQARPLTVADLHMNLFETFDAQSRTDPLKVVTRFRGQILGVDAVKPRSWGDETVFTGTFPLMNHHAPKGLRKGPNLETRTIRVEYAAGLDVTDRKIDAHAWYAPIILQRAEVRLSELIATFNRNIINTIERCFKNASEQWTPDEFPEALGYVATARAELARAKEAVRSAEFVLHNLARAKLVTAIETEEPDLFDLIPREKLETIEREISFFL